MRISDWSSDVCSSDLMDAAEAERAGLVARVFPAESLLEETLKAARVIAEKSLPATMMIKESVNRAFETTLAEGIRRSEERGVGKECVSTCRSRWSPFHQKKNIRLAKYTYAELN